MAVPRRDQVRREVSEIGSLYLIVVILVLVGAILVHLSPRAEVSMPTQPVPKELGPN